MEMDENMESVEIPEGDDIQETGLTEEADSAESLESVMDDTGTDTEDEDSGEEPQGTGGRKEPGYVQSRIQKAVAKERAAMQADFDRQLAEMRDDFDRQMAPYREHLMSLEAQELVRSGKVKDLETAKELVRYRQGGRPQPEAEAPAQGGQDDRDPAIQARIDMLNHQADRIGQQTGLDVINEFMTNEETKEKVVSGEWDFYDVAEAMKKQKAARKTPAPMRSPNGASGSEKSTIASMSDEQFARLERKIKEGARYSIR